MEMIAALFVEKHGPYGNLPGVDAWHVERDARAYRGPCSVVAHPPCKRWGRYWGGGPSVKVPRIMGDDNGTFAAALWSVRTFGGVLEHPEASHAFPWFGLPVPDWRAGWTKADRYGGRSCCVAQGHYGHPARKLTWLYACSDELPELKWSTDGDWRRLDEGFHSSAERAASTRKPRQRLSRDERLHTPARFRDVLINIAESSSFLVTV
jgi:hypothetical protein